MNRAYQLQYCKICKKRGFSREKGIICSLTHEHAAFENSCDNFDRDEIASIQETSTKSKEIAAKLSSDSFDNIYSGYLFTLYFSIVLIAAGALIGRTGGPIIMFFGIITFIVAVVLSMIILYRIWKYIIDQHRVHNQSASISTPGQAVGFLFIPFFNIYWMFMSIGKLPQNLNALSKMRKSSSFMPEALGILICIFSLSGIIPAVGIVLSIVSGYILLPILYKRAIDAIAKIPPASIDLIVEPTKTEKIDIASIRDYSTLFDKKRFGINFYVGLFILVAALISRLIMTIIQMGFDNSFGFGAKFYLSDTFSNLLFVLIILIFSHSIKHKFFLALTIGIAHLITSTGFRYILYFFYGRNGYINLENLINIPSTLISFVYGFVFIYSLVVAIKMWGIELWSIFIASISAMIIVHASWYMLDMFLNKSEFHFEFSMIYVPLTHAVFYALAIYGGFRLYLMPHSVKSYKHLTAKMLDSDI